INGTSPDFLGEPLERGVRRPALLDGLPARRLHGHGLLPRLPPRLAVPAAQQGAHRALQLRRLHEVVPLPVQPQRHGDAQDGHQQERVRVLLVVERPWQHRHAEPEALEDGVPPAVRHEPAHGGVGEDVLLRRPRRPHEPPPLGLVQEPLGEELVEHGVRGHPLPRPAVLGRAAQHPQEAVLAPLQRGGYLPHLGRRQEALAAEADEQHGRRGLRVQPPHALVRLLRRRGERDHRADRVHRRRGHPARAPAVGDGVDDALLELRRRVDDEAGGLHVAPPGFEEPPVGRHLLLVKHRRREHGRRHRRQPGNVQRAIHLREFAGHLLVEHRRVQQQLQHDGAGGEVHVGRHAELGGHVERRRAEDVGDERGHGAIEPGDGGPHVGPVAPQYEGDPLLDAGVDGRHVDGGEVPEADVVGAGGLLALHLGRDVDRRLRRRRRHEEHGDRQRAAAAAEQPLAGLDHGHEVAGAPHGQQHHRRLRHRLDSNSNDASAARCAAALYESECVLVLLYVSNFWTVKGEKYRETTTPCFIQNLNISSYVCE
ncbi:hypothetical protein EE612_039510, partial [Oryza sativa]